MRTGRFCDAGVWKLTQHPNWFGNLLLWTVRGACVSARRVRDAPRGSAAPAAPTAPRAPPTARPSHCATLPPRIPRAERAPPNSAAVPVSTASPPRRGRDESAERPSPPPLPARARAGHLCHEHACARGARAGHGGLAARGAAGGRRRLSALLVAPLLGAGLRRDARRRRAGGRQVRGRRGLQGVRGGDAAARADDAERARVASRRRVRDPNLMRDAAERRAAPQRGLICVCVKHCNNPRTTHDKRLSARAGLLAVPPMKRLALTSKLNRRHHECPPGSRPRMQPRQDSTIRIRAVAAVLCKMIRSRKSRHNRWKKEISFPA
eukprot:3789712-Prymnesium_polylepis.1